MEATPSHDAPFETLRAARARYFAENRFPSDGGYAVRWVRLQAGPLPIFFPNTAARVRAVRFHDLHHALTGYATSWTGEAEIGAWEIASSCAHHTAAWVLNLDALAVGLVIAPRRCWRAFLRGRHTRNLYREVFDDALLDQRLADVRRRLDLDRAAPAARPRDRAAFALWALLAVATLTLSVAALWVPMILFARWALG